MLELRPNCECCDTDLPAASKGAYICSFECTFCADCATSEYGGVCPNCGGGLMERPVRATALLEKFPASASRVIKPHQHRPH